MFRFPVLVSLSLVLLACDGVNHAVDGRTQALNIAEQREKQCLDTFPDLIKSSDALLDQGKAGEAAEVLRDCTGPLLGKAAEYVLALDRVNAARLKQQIEGIPKQQWQDRLRVLEEWDGLVEKLPPPFDKELAALYKRQQEADARRNRHRQQAEALKYYAFCTELGRLVRAKGPLGERGEAFMGVAKSKYGIRDGDEYLMSERELQIGMPMCAVVGSLGNPSEVREIASARGKVWSVWYSERKVLIYLNEDQEVVRYSR